MGVWVSKMSAQTAREGRRRAYYAYGSGLFPVPEERTNEIHNLKNEFHAKEARFAMLIAMARRAP